jgi:hypothetical protein
MNIIICDDIAKDASELADMLASVGETQTAVFFFFF